MPFLGYSIKQAFSNERSDCAKTVSAICLTPEYIDLTTGILRTRFSPMRIKDLPRNPLAIQPTKVVKNRKTTTPKPLILMATS